MPMPDGATSNRQFRGSHMYKAALRDESFDQLSTEEMKSDFVRDINAEVSVAAPSAIVACVSILFLFKGLDDMVEDHDIMHDCHSYAPLQNLQVSMLALTAISSMFVMYVATAIWFVSTKLVVAPPEVYLYFFFEVKAWRVRARMLYAMSVPMIFFSIGVHPAAWCQRPALGISMLTLFGAAGVVGYQLTCKAGLIPVAAPLEIITNRYKACHGPLPQHLRDLVPPCDPRANGTSEAQKPTVGKSSPKSPGML